MGVEKDIIETRGGDAIRYFHKGKDHVATPIISKCFAKKGNQPKDEDKVVELYHRERLAELDGRRLPLIYHAKLDEEQLKNSKLSVSFPNSFKPKVDFARTHSLLRKKIEMEAKEGAFDGKMIGVRNFKVIEDFVSGNVMDTLNLEVWQTHYFDFLATSMVQDLDLGKFYEEMGQKNPFSGKRTLRKCYETSDGNIVSLNKSYLANVIGEGFIPTLNNGNRLYLTKGPEDVVAAGTVNSLGYTSFWDETWSKGDEISLYNLLDEAASKVFKEKCGLESVKFDLTGCYFLHELNRGGYTFFMEHKLGASGEDVANMATQTKGMNQYDSIIEVPPVRGALEDVCEKLNLNCYDPVLLHDGVATGNPQAKLHL